MGRENYERTPWRGERKRERGSPWRRAKAKDRARKCNRLLSQEFVFSSERVMYVSSGAIYGYGRSEDVFFPI